MVYVGYGLIFIYLIGHIYLCIALWWHMIETRTAILPAVIVLPVVGPLLFLIDQSQHRGLHKASKTIGLESMRIDDIKYQRIQVDDQDDPDQVVPLEEAMVINDSGTQRKLLIDVLEKDPSEQISLLLAAGLARDVEVVHYATTTMAQIQTEFEQRITQLEEAALNDSEDMQVNKNLQKTLGQYVESGLLTGGILRVYQEKYIEVLKKTIEHNPQDSKSLRTLFYCYMKMDDLVLAKHVLAKYRTDWPMEQSGYEMLIYFYMRTNDEDGIRRAMEQIHEKGIYLSSEGKKWLSFWEA